MSGIFIPSAALNPDIWSHSTPAISVPNGALTPISVGVSFVNGRVSGTQFTSYNSTTGVFTVPEGTYLVSISFTQQYGAGVNARWLWTLAGLGTQIYDTSSRLNGKLFSCIVQNTTGASTTLNMSQDSGAAANILSLLLTLTKLSDD